MDATLLVAIVGAISTMLGTFAGLVGAFVALQRMGPQNRVSEGDAAQKITEAAAVSVDLVQRQLQELQGRVGILSGELAEVRRLLSQRDAQVNSMQLVQTSHEEGIRRLAAQVVSLGGLPVYTLPGQIPGKT